MKIALVGVGKIALDQHVPSLAASPDWELAATVSRQGRVSGVEAFTDMTEMLTARPDIRVVSLCLPPVPRFAYARAAIAAGRHVMLEKPPGATLSECHALADLARAAGVSLFATWHSREAAMVDAARAWLADKTVHKLHINWREDVRKWHPGQDWCFEPGGMGVFDPGINALSIMTKILPAPVHLVCAKLSFPENRQTPIAAELTFTDGVSAYFNWDHQGPEFWDIEVQTDAGTLTLHEGGARMVINGAEQGAAAGLQGEYPRLYNEMAELVATGGIDMDLSPLRHVADAFMLGERVTVPPFDW
ncbi:Gfo/Idh/MocA family protein [Tropicibacter naphthalenivorans]|uniref:L-arabinose 1-dehydrogenase n=1 Tax=Tropicibacter naphthalenivorans TaxID=441103 RepID=A0A0N7LYM5_9RHOB|nr:Gfo/Idh/MocA family oxidoreductase [Tropicibacter naphthalenivorans]CUH75281.1 L-arabinose 1-dehydrogenase [Tropicibacter naphthalenivorans]SMC45255.1 D-galactose 1-dehydrogenase [Tropicibacter naphthalenivorans]